MKKSHVSLFLAAGLTTLLATVTARAQITTPFPSGINDFSAPKYALNVGNYASMLSSYYFASTANVPSDISKGLNGWKNTPLNLTSVLGGDPWLSGGGTVKTIYLGETAGWQNDFGYISSADPSNHIALISNIVGQGNIFSGSEAYVNYAAGTSLDFFLNSGGPLNQGGLFYTFGDANQYSGSDMSSHVKWKVVDMNTTYLDNGVLTTGLVKTLLVGFEDTRKGVSFYDGDFNDLVVAFQFLPDQFLPVPEPSTYGIIGALGLCALVGYRRLKNARAKSATA